MSGGVDSSVAAALLSERGYDVVGVMMRLWSEAGEEAGTNKCCSLESVHDARAVADRLTIPFYVIDVQQPFYDRVVAPFIREYSAGRTPNPCLACNRHIRYGYLLDYARKLDADYLATGHYARIRRDEFGHFQLLRGVDPGKDQSYVLSVLGQHDLAQTLFPVGEYTKAQIRSMAAERGLPTASRVDSQDLCFVADGDYRRFLSEVSPEAVQPGPILDLSGRQLGTHRGLPFYTIGQRSGLGIGGPRPLYVSDLDVANNAVIVGTADELGRTSLRTADVNWVAGHPPSMRAFAVGVQIRYRARPAGATVTSLADGTAQVAFDAPIRDITPGQAAVFYDGETCLGGALIEESGYGV